MSHITDPRDQIDAGPKWDEDDPVICEQPATWCFWNHRGQVVIRQKQQTGYCDDDEPFLFISIENVPTLVAALQTKLSEFARFAGVKRGVPEPALKAEAENAR
jgi:hypothetical protein